MDLRRLEEAGVRMIRTRDLRIENEYREPLPIRDEARKERVRLHSKRIQRELKCTG